MPRLLLLTLIICAELSAHAQVPDFISIKKRNGITVKNYYAGLNISLITKDGKRYDALIQRIANDSLYLRYFTTTPYANLFGTVSYDTVTTYILQMHYKNIQYILTPRTQHRGYALSKLGKYAAIAGLGYTFLNLFNGLTQRSKPLLDKHNARNVAIASSIGTGGLVLNRKFRNNNKRNRYKIVYVNLSNRQP